MKRNRGALALACTAALALAALGVAGCGTTATTTENANAQFATTSEAADGNTVDDVTREALDKDITSLNRYYETMQAAYGEGYKFTAAQKKKIANAEDLIAQTAELNTSGLSQDEAEALDEQVGKAAVQMLALVNDAPAAEY